MIKTTANSMMAGAILLCSSVIAMAGPPYNLTGSAPGAQFTPHVAQPSLKQKPVISRSLGHAKAKKKIAKKKARPALQPRHPASHAAPVPPVSGAQANVGLSRPVTGPGGRSLLPPNPNHSHSTDTSRLKDARSSNHTAGAKIGQRHLASPGVRLLPGNTATNAAAGRARAIGEAGNRMQQIREMQRLRKMGSPMDQALGGGNANAQQDCAHSPNPAACLQHNMQHPGSGTSLPNGDDRRSMRACLQAGGNLATCRQGGGKKVPGTTFTAGSSGDPRAALKDPRGVASTEGGEHSESCDDNSCRSEDVHHNPDGGTTTDRTTWTSLHGGRGTRTKTTRDRHGVVIFHRVERNRHPGPRADTIDGVSRTRIGPKTYEEQRFHTDAHGHTTYGPRRIVHPRSHPTSQAAPEGGQEKPVNCWDLPKGSGAYNQCMVDIRRPRGKTLVVQPGPNGENPGTKPAGTSIAPDIGIAGAINCGDAGSEACNRGSSGLSSGGRRLDHKDRGLGGVPSGGGVPQ